MTCPLYDGLVVHENLLVPQEGLVWQVNKNERGGVWLLET
jgi:hypothetical protein